MHRSGAWCVARLLGTLVRFIALPRGSMAASAPAEVLACSIERTYDCGTGGCRSVEDGLVQTLRYRVDTATRQVCGTHAAPLALVRSAARRGATLSAPRSLILRQAPDWKT